MFHYEFNYSVEENYKIEPFFSSIFFNYEEEKTS